MATEWFRWWHGTVSDPKFAWVARRAGVTLSDVIAAWAALLETASNDETRGNVSRFDAVSYDCIFGKEDGFFDRIIFAMQEKGLIDSDGNVINWSRRQPKREDIPNAESRAKSSTERVRAYRERMRAASSGGNDDGNETNETIVKRSETQKPSRLDKDKEVNPPISPQGGNTPSGDESVEQDSPEEADHHAAKQRRAGTTFADWIADCKASGVKPVSEYVAVWSYAEKVGLPREFVELAWVWFKTSYTSGEKMKRKRYIDWRAVFLRSVKECWSGYWFWSDREGRYVLTTTGQQADKDAA